MTVVAGAEIPVDFAVAQDRLTVVEQRIGVLQQELQQSLIQALFLALDDGLATDKGSEAAFRLANLDGKAKPGLQHMVLIGDVVPEVTKRLFHPTAVENLHATKAQLPRLRLLP